MLLNAPLPDWRELKPKGQPSLIALFTACLSFHSSASTLKATFSTSGFLNYALTSDLLEGELIEELASRHVGRLDLALRTKYLPSLDAAFDLQSRSCVGGVQALFAVARDDDYVILVQVRSSRVLNLTGRLALIPKAFHQPVIEAPFEVSLANTLARELEEELLGRDDLEMLDDDSRADPLHPKLRSEPMRWLQERFGSTYRIECTGFGINMVTGNYEFSGLVVIDDPEWWRRFGHQVEANWETTQLQRYSTRDTDGLRRLATDPRWSNEGLFAYLQGLRRLSVVGAPARLNLPQIEVNT